MYTLRPEIRFRTGGDRGSKKRVAVRPDGPPSKGNSLPKLAASPRSLSRDVPCAPPCLEISPESTIDLEVVLPAGARMFVCPALRPSGPKSTFFGSRDSFSARWNRRHVRGARSPAPGGLPSRYCCRAGRGAAANRKSPGPNNAREHIFRFSIFRTPCNPMRLPIVHNKVGGGGRQRDPARTARTHSKKAARRC